MLGGVGVGDEGRFFNLLDDRYSARLQRLLHISAPLQNRTLSLKLLLQLFDPPIGIGTDEHHHRLAVRAMLRLAEEVGSDESRVGAGGGDHHHFARTGGHVDRARSLSNLGFRFRDEAIARTEDLVDSPDRLRSIGERPDRLGSADFIHRIHAAEFGGIQDRRMDLPFPVRRSAEDDLPAAGDLRRKGQHQDGGKERSGAAGDVQPHPADRDDLSLQGHPLHHFDFLSR